MKEKIKELLDLVLDAQEKYRGDESIYIAFKTSNYQLINVFVAKDQVFLFDRSLYSYDQLDEFITKTKQFLETI